MQVQGSLRRVSEPVVVYHATYGKHTTIKTLRVILDMVASLRLLQHRIADQEVLWYIRNYSAAQVRLPCREHRDALSNPNHMTREDNMFCIYS